MEYEQLEDGKLVDTNTGEILDYRTVQYDKVAYSYPAKHVLDYSKFDSPMRLKEWCLQNGYKGSAELKVDIQYAKDLAGRDSAKVFMLAREIKYINVAFIKTSELSNIWDTQRPNVIRTLDRLQDKGVLFYTAKGLYKTGWIRVVFNPMCFTKSRMVLPDYIKDCPNLPASWPKPQLLITPKVGWDEHYKSLQTPNKDTLQTAITPYDTSLEYAPLEGFDEDYKSAIETINQRYSGDRLSAILYSTPLDYQMFMEGLLDIEDMGKNSISARYYQ